MSKRRALVVTATFVAGSLVLVGCGGGGGGKKSLPSGLTGQQPGSTQQPGSGTPTGGTTTGGGGTTTGGGGGTTTGGGGLTGLPGVGGGGTTTGGGGTTTGGGGTTTGGGGTTGGGTPPATNFPFGPESFEAAPYGNVATDGAQTQALQQPQWGVYQLQGGAATGQNAAGISGPQGYVNDASEILVLPKMDFSTAVSPELTFSHVYDIEHLFDGAKVAIYDWQTQQYSYPDPVGGYPEQNLMYQTPDDGWYTGTAGISQTAITWQQASFDLSAFAGRPEISIVFWFVSDDSVPGAGWFIDDISVAESTGAPPAGGTPPAGGGTGTTPPAATTVFAEDFEGAAVNMGSAGLGVWFADDPSSFNVAGAPATAHQGSFCAGTSFATQYPNSAADLLFTPELDFAGKTTASLEFQHHYSFEVSPNSQGQATAWDGGRILLTPDLGTSWYIIAPDSGYSAPFVAALGTQGFGGTSGGWQAVTVDLAPALAIGPKWTIAWEFASDDSVRDAGWYIDEIQVTGR